MSPTLTPLSDAPSSPSTLPDQLADEEITEFSRLSLEEKRRSDPTRRLPVFIKRVSLPTGVTQDVR